MPLSKVARLCFETSSFFKYDVFEIREGVNDLNKKRNKYGEFSDLYEEYKKSPENFYEYTGMSVETFDYILGHIEDYLQQGIIAKRVVTNPEKLFLTLRYLRHGTSFQSLAHSYRLGRSAVAKNIYQTLKAMWQALSPLYMPQAKQEDLKKNADNFFSKWQFPNCIGSIDKKTYLITRPTYRNNECYEKDYSLVLQAISDANYKFIAIEVCGKGQKTESGNFHYSQLNRLLTKNRFNVPPPENLSGSDERLPHVLVGNETYPLKTFLMRPYPRVNLNREKSIFNIRLARAREAINGAFRILTNKWQIFMGPLKSNIPHAKLIIKVACVLHNIVRQKDGNQDKDFKEFIDNLCVPISRKKIIRSRSNNRSSARAIRIRDRYANYFVNNPI